MQDIENISDEITRLEVAIPYNPNTYLIVYELRDYLFKIFGGITYSKIVFPSPFAGMWEDTKSKSLTLPDPEDTVIFILYFSFSEIPKIQEVLKTFARMILKTGETETWLVLQSAKRLKYKKDKEE